MFWNLAGKGKILVIESGGGVSIRQEPNIFSTNGLLNTLLSTNSFSSYTYFATEPAKASAFPAQPWWVRSNTWIGSLSPLFPLAVRESLFSIRRFIFYLFIMIFFFLIHTCFLFFLFDIFANPLTLVLLLYFEEIFKWACSSWSHFFADCFVWVIICCCIHSTHVKISLFFFAIYWYSIQHIYGTIWILFCNVLHCMSLSYLLRRTMRWFCLLCIGKEESKRRPANKWPCDRSWARGCIRGNGYSWLILHIYIHLIQSYMTKY